MTALKTKIPRTWRYIAAFVAFMALLLVSDILRWLASPDSPWWMQSPAYWIMPLQAILCGWILWLFRDTYRLRAPKQLIFTTFIGILVFIIWVAPQAFLGFDPRTDGFQVDEVTSNTGLQLLLLSLRFIRLVIVVPFLEELFWRGFLLRYFVNDHFWKVAVGRTNAFGFVAVTILFALAHSEADRPAALLTSALYNIVFLKTRSVASCILAHAITNLALGIYIMVTKQWGFW